MTNKHATEIKDTSRRALIKNITRAAAISSVAFGMASTHASESIQSAGSGKKAGHNQHVIDSCFECSKVGQQCLDHCITLVAGDDTSIAGCLAAVRIMLPVLEATLALASSNSDQFLAQAKVCKSVCETCSVECEKHAHHHAECKACMESCNECIDAIDKVLSA